jgi:hypothetical protein
MLPASTSITDKLTNVGQLDFSANATALSAFPPLLHPTSCVPTTTLADKQADLTHYLFRCVWPLLSSLHITLRRQWLPALCNCLGQTQVDTLVSGVRLGVHEDCTCPARARCKGKSPQ